MLRRARGFAPLPIHLRALKISTLAVGAHLKNTVALSVGENVFVSQHIGDLETEQAYRAFKNAVADLPRLYEAKPEIIACDMHPEYLSTKFAHEHSKDPELFPVPHHWAHVASCMAENEIEAPALGVAWDERIRSGRDDLGRRIFARQRRRLRTRRAPAAVSIAGRRCRDQETAPDCSRVA